MRTISFQDLFVKPSGSTPPAIRRKVTCVFFGSCFSRRSRVAALRSGARLVPFVKPATQEKGSIGFILGGGHAPAVSSTRPALTTAIAYATPPGDAMPAPAFACVSKADDPVAVGCEHRWSKRPATELVADGESSPMPAPKKRKARICKEPGCDKYVVDHGLCIRHGGGKRCNVEGCNCRAQNRGLCWKHGGFTICKVEGCAKRAKSRGICWSHGGGTRCKTEGCAKIAVSVGRCWAHGGGKRCAMDKCKKPASERTNNLCPDHFAWCQRDLFGSRWGVTGLQETALP